MEGVLKKKIYVNENVFISKLKNGKQYILMKVNDELVPLFVKEEIIKVISFLKDNNCNKEELLSKFGGEINQYIDILSTYGIISYETRETNLKINFDYEDQVNKLNYYAYKTRTPLMAKVEITYNCNYKCKYCYVKDVKAKFMPFDDLKVIMKKLKDNGVNRLFITGGEPFLHPDILKIIKYSSELRFVTIVQSNASLINEEIALELKKIKNVELGISFHSCNKEKFDKFTQVKESFNKTMIAVRHLQKLNVPFYLKLPVTYENQEDLKENIKYLEKNKFNFKIYTQILPNIKDKVDNSKYVIKNEYIEWLYENKYLKFNKTMCTALKTKLWISAEGDLYPCELTREVLGNLIKEDFDEIWFGDKAKKVLNSNIFIEPKQCEKCDKKDYCNKCLAYINYKEWKNGLRFFCNSAEAVKKYY